jgi:hypothetical protein
MYKIVNLTFIIILKRIIIELVEDIWKKRNVIANQNVNVDLSVLVKKLRRLLRVARKVKILHGNKKRNIMFLFYFLK